MDEERENHRKSMERGMVGFVRDLNKIVVDVCRKNDRDRDLRELRDKFFVVRKENPNGLVEIAGPYIWKYRKQIESRDASFFLTNSFEDDIIGSSPNGVAEVSEFSDVPVLLQKIKKTWHQFDEDEKSVVMKTVANLLKNYSLYSFSCKKLKELGN
jgi:hypothetical protein